MKILKFGGTSVGTPQRMKDVCQLITDGERKIVVLSAMSGTTNSLVEIADYIKKKILRAQAVLSISCAHYTVHMCQNCTASRKMLNIQTTCSTTFSCICTTLQPNLIVQLSKRRFWHKAN